MVYTFNANDGILLWLTERTKWNSSHEIEAESEVGVMRMATIVLVPRVSLLLVSSARLVMTGDILSSRAIDSA